MIYVNSIAEAKGQWINDEVQVLEAPYFDEELQKWCALANAYGTLAFVSLRVTPPQPEKPA